MSDKATEVIRYTKETMISLHDSPLVQKPENMPSLLTWFGEDPESPASKSILNGYVITRTSSEKSIVLGPTKTNFASSLYGGLKNQNEHYHTTSTKTQPMSNSRYSHHQNHTRQMDDRNNTTSIREYRSPRGPSFMNDRGFSHNRQDKPTDNRKFMNSPPHKRNNNNNNNHHHHERTNNTSNGKLHHHRNNRHHELEGSERVPEWMDYTPDEETIEEVREDTKKEKELEMHDLEAWKSSMKQKDNPVTTAIEAPLSSLSLEPSPDPLLFFDESSEPRREQKGGSRFAKFFAKREEPPHHETEETNTPQPRSISLNDLFQQPSPKKRQEDLTEPHIPQAGRIYSEEDILKSLGAKKETTSPDEQLNEEGAMGFNRVLQILSQPKPSLSSSSHSSSTPEEHASPSPKLVHENTGSESSSRIANRFGNNNLPTSVLRQMSARSSNEGKSPLLQNTKSTPTSTKPVQPVFNHPPPPHMPPLPMPPQQFFAMQQNGPYSPGHPMMDHRAFEQLMQFNNDPRMPPPHPHHLRNGTNGDFLPPHMMMGPPPPPLPPGQRPMMTPPQFNQQLPLHMQRFPLQQQQQQQQQQQMTSMLPHLLANGKIYLLVN
ncbi:hypothetical protein EDC96DRAFT_485862 [Choanephora cucurbitarum]|nr:hypothetical protein EDC96DRAFT_485862 [Choanephora cucurbitarum]